MYMSINPLCWPSVLEHRPKICDMQTDSGLRQEHTPELYPNIFP